MTSTVLTQIGAILGAIATILSILAHWRINKK